MTVACFFFALRDKGGLVKNYLAAYISLRNQGRRSLGCTHDADRQEPLCTLAQAFRGTMNRRSRPG